MGGKERVEKGRRSGEQRLEGRGDGMMKEWNSCGTRRWAR